MPRSQAGRGALAELGLTAGGPRPTPGKSCVPTLGAGTLPPAYLIVQILFVLAPNTTEAKHLPAKVNQTKKCLFKGNELILDRIGQTRPNSF